MNSTYFQAETLNIFILPCVMLKFHYNVMIQHIAAYYILFGIIPATYKQKYQKGGRNCKKQYALFLKNISHMPRM